MGYEIDPYFIGAELFNKCVKNGFHGRDAMFKSDRQNGTTCDDLPEQYITVNIANSVESVISVNGFDVEHYYYVATGGTIDLGERVKRVNVLDSEGIVRDMIWSDMDGNVIVAPQYDQVVEEGRDHPIGSETIRLSETSPSGLTSPSEYATYAVIQIVSAPGLVAESINGNPNASLSLTYLANYTLDGAQPSQNVGYVASHGTTIKLDSMTQIKNFTIISNTDSNSFGSDIRPTAIATYYIGTSRFGRI